MKSKIIIAIDGPAGSGKSTVAKLVAARLRIPYIDTGAMYRAVTLKALKDKIPFQSARRLIQAAKNSRIEFKGTDPLKQRVYLDGTEVTKQIRLPELTRNVFYIARKPGIRCQMVKKQRRIGKKLGAVMEGRDIGTKVFPRADFKFYFEARPEVRARRRYQELKKSGHRARYQRVFKELVARDKTDLQRKEGPLRKAKDAILIDTTELTIKQVVDTILRSVCQAIL